MSRRPNILVILADQHRHDCLGVSGNADIRTPHLDALARDGVYHDRAFSCFPVCTPARYSMLTGLYVHQHLGWTNRSTLPSGVPTFPRILRDSGYRTRAVGKMHFSPTYLDVGFERMWLAEQDGPGRYDDDYHRWLRERGLCDRVDLVDQVRAYRERAPRAYWETFGALQSDLDEAHHSTTWIAERAMEAIRGWDDGQHLLMVGFVKPHHPFDPPAPWDALYDPASLSLLPGWTESCAPEDLAYARGYFDDRRLTPESLRRVMALYYATITQIDHHVGRFVGLLRRKGLYDRTVIVYTGDHGDYLGYHHLLLKGRAMYEPLIRIPLIVKYPGAQRHGTSCSRLVSTVDLAPTILHLAGCDAPRSMSGVNLFDPAGHEAVFAEAPGAREYMVRSRRHKLLARRDRQASRLFDLDSDPYELLNVIDEPAHAPALANLQARLSAWALFGAPSREHADQAAPTITGANVPRQDDGHVQEGQRYFRERMDECLEVGL